MGGRVEPERQDTIALAVVTLVAAALPFVFIWVLALLLPGKEWAGAPGVGYALAAFVVWAGHLAVPVRQEAVRAFVGWAAMVPGIVAVFVWLSAGLSSTGSTPAG